MRTTASHEVRHIMGMPIGIDVRGAGVDLEPAFAWLRQVDATFSTYREDSEISRIDRGELEPERASGAVRWVLARCDLLREETKGAFDVRSGGRLDPSAFVKGWAVQRAAELLADEGFTDFCLNAGGDIVVRGGALPEPAWRVGIRHPHDRNALAAAIVVTDVAVATSGTYERGAHLLDPRSGTPAAGVLSVTVIGPDLGLADAYSTAAFALGPDGPEWTRDLDGYEAMTIMEDGRVLCTAGFPEDEA
jgi:thiamine biosynthesis lipoprotein